MASGDGVVCRRTRYVSCIKVNGYSILPPLLNDERRAEMQRYKKLAIQVEQKLRSRVPRPCSESSDGEHSTTYLHTDKSSTCDSSEDMNTTRDDFNDSSRVDVLHMLEDKDRTNAAIEVPSRKPGLTMRQESYTLEGDSRVFPDDVLKSIATTDASCDKMASDGCGEGGGSDKAAPPRLLRSDSFTLDSPSPLLLAQMRRATKEPKCPQTEPKSMHRKRRSWDLASAKKKWSSIENDVGAPPPYRDRQHKRQSVPNIRPQPRLGAPSKPAERELSPHPATKVRGRPAPAPATARHGRSSSGSDTAASRRLVAVANTPPRSPRAPVTPGTPATPADWQVSPQDYVCEIFSKIQRQQSRQMSELLARQKEEQERLVQLFTRQQSLLVCKIREAYQSAPVALTGAPRSPPSSSMTLQCTPDGSSDTLAEPGLSPALQSDGGAGGEQRAISQDSLDKTVCNGTATTGAAASQKPCGRQLFPTARQVWAATRICAAARGFLVRRLMRTEHVQNLVKTVHDTLVVAMKVHQDAVDDIQPSDVEFHRQLIQQITAACMDFHNVFFGLSVSERMSVIANDRRRLRDRQQRPSSGRSSTSLSSATQRVLERKQRRDSADLSSSSNKSSRSCQSGGGLARTRARSICGAPESMRAKREPGPNCPIRRTMSFGANKKPWR